MSGRSQEVSAHPVHSKEAPRLPNPGEGPDPTAAAAAFPDLCGGVIEKKPLRKHLLSWNHTAVSQNGENKSFFMSYWVLHCSLLDEIEDKQIILQK